MSGAHRPLAGTVRAVNDHDRVRTFRELFGVGSAFDNAPKLTPLASRPQDGDGFSEGSDPLDRLDLVIEAPLRDWVPSLGLAASPEMGYVLSDIRGTSTIVISPGGRSICAGASSWALFRRRTLRRSCSPGQYSNTEVRPMTTHVCAHGPDERGGRMTLPASARSYAIPLPDGITGELRWVGGPMTKRAIAHLRKWIDFYEETISEPEATAPDAASRSADASTSEPGR